MAFVVDLAKPPERLTCIAYGHSGSGKTYFAGTWPRPLVIADASEHGWKTLHGLADDDLYESGKLPYVVAVETPHDFMEVLRALEMQAQGGRPDFPGWPVPQGKHEIGTVVVDSLTFYADSALAAFLDANSSRVDKRQIYGDLGNHLRAVMLRVHKLPYHAVWTALASINEDAKVGGPLIAGATSAKAPARCDLWVYLAVEEKKIAKAQHEIIYSLHTQNHGGYRSRHRFGDKLPAELEPNFILIEEALGLTPWKGKQPAKKIAMAK